LVLPLTRQPLRIARPLVRTKATRQWKPHPIFNPFFISKYLARNMKKITAIFASALLILNSSCGRFVDGYEVSPNDPTSVTNDLLLTTTEISTFSLYSGQLARLAAVLMQHQAGTDSQFEDLARYNIRSGDNVNEWEQLYSVSLMNTKKLIEQAGDNNKHYRGIAKVLTAMNLGIATDLWGDIPYSQALKGLNGQEGFNPSYDSQEAILNSIQTLLSEAITDLSSDPTSTAQNVKLPGNDDLVFQGDAQKWIVTAHVLKARYANRLSKRDPQGSATAALGHLDMAFTAGLASPADDCNAKFGTAGNELNQWNAFLFNRGGYMKMGKFFMDTLIGMNDPRLTFYATEDANGNYTGTALGSNDNTTSEIGSYFASANSPAPMVTYVEARFIEAEAALRANNPSRAATAYNDAVLTHIQQVTGSPAPTAYANQYASETSGSITLEKIMLQKYLAMFTQIETWSDWRRTGIPSLSADPRATSNAIPRRLPTPQSEINYNRNAPNITNLYQAVWWDQ
jgi:hypothetical protein